MKRFYTPLINTFNATYFDFNELVQEIICECAYLEKRKSSFTDVALIESIIAQAREDVLTLQLIDYPNPCLDTGDFSVAFCQRLPLKYLKARWIFFKYQSSQKLDQFYKQCDVLVY
ncbi:MULTISPECIES: hypothetical protein [Pasteurellaceae]|uniref:Uncharacterized protein n=1 Tax=Gallibacterium anatis TaxID=750 RepID=A0AAX3XGL3_9PAST|nr:hypothetical protein [Gallibacterium anatis]MDK9431175.1 hypothetical protein [Gallibacterium anatis]WIM80720.1 hypothetical protein QP018_05690 [Gallibacterium anatis]HDX1022591.1 hypothetical protein [Pasteurella multocida]